jgi:hypothetical protein
LTISLAIESGVSGWYRKKKGLVRPPPRSRYPRDLRISQRELLGYLHKGARSTSRIIHRKVENLPKLLSEREMSYSNRQ